MRPTVPTSQRRGLQKGSPDRRARICGRIIDPNRHRCRAARCGRPRYRPDRAYNARDPSRSNVARHKRTVGAAHPLITASRAVGIDRVAPVLAVDAGRNARRPRRHHSLQRRKVARMHNRRSSSRKTAISAGRVSKGGPETCAAKRTAHPAVALAAEKRRDLGQSQHRMSPTRFGKRLIRLTTPFSSPPMSKR